MLPTTEMAAVQVIEQPKLPWPDSHLSHRLHEKVDNLQKIPYKPLGKRKTLTAVKRSQAMLSVPIVFSPDKIQFVMLSFEGPDHFAMAGGLSIRAQELCSSLATQGYDVHLYFIGDPMFAPTEQRGNWHLYRWCQWISSANPGGCYVAERLKVDDYGRSVPPAVVRDVIVPAAQKGSTTVVLAEEWQTIPAVFRLREALRENNLESRVMILWNANNLYGFEGVNWPRLNEACIITSVSRYMKHRMWLWGVNPVVIHNGIPSRLLEPVNEDIVQKLRQIFPNLLLAKVGRYDVDKRWLMAMKAVGEMKRQGMRPTLIARGGTEYHRFEVMREAEAQGLTWKELQLNPKAPPEEILHELDKCRDYDVLELCFFVDEAFLDPLYAGADAVLANSGHEPFGLVGLEVMACGGLAFVGSTGEDYAQTMVNSVVIETEDPLEIVESMRTLQADKELSQALRQEGRRTAACFTWDRIIIDLFQKIRFLSTSRGIELN